MAQQRGWLGFDGYVQFWSAYQRMCLAHAKALPWPVKILPAWSEIGAFDDQTAFRFFFR